MNSRSFDAAFVVSDKIFGQARGAADPLREALDLFVVRLPRDFFGDRDVRFDQKLFRSAALAGVFTAGQFVGDFNRPRLEGNRLGGDFAIAQRGEVRHLMQRLGRGRWELGLRDPTRRGP